MNDSQLWFEINRELVAKAISELLFEEVLIQKNSEIITSSGASWKFQGLQGVWRSMKIRPASITRNGNEFFEASEFFLDIQKETGMSDITLGNFFEEMHNTLLADLSLKKKAGHLKVTELANWNGEKLQQVQTGHPKILLSKGRVGWTAADRELYSPESASPFQLVWIAVKKGILSHSFPQELLDQSFNEETKKELSKILKTHDLLPVHPWQWDRYITTQFIAEISKGEMILLGKMGDYYLPQTSLRTLSNVTRPLCMDVKLPLSVLNTSCVRGLPAKYVEIGKTLSQRLHNVCEKDPKLTNVIILKEKEGLVYKHAALNKIQGAPYRYHELLGAVWRESAISKLQNDEKAILTAALFHQDGEGNSLIAEYIRRSGQSADIWLKAFFEVTLIPLLHLQTQYGVGLVAHGQNIVLVLKNNFPHSMILKDFHGDMRLSNELPPEGKKAFGEFADTLTTLPPHYLIHDLITGSLITVHRFISLVMKESMNYSEENYYRIMATVLKSEPGSHLLLRSEIEKLLLNKVRFKIGYGDSEERPLPILGGPLENPLYEYTL